MGEYHPLRDESPALAYTVEKQCSTLWMVQETPLRVPTYSLITYHLESLICALYQIKAKKAIKGMRLLLGTHSSIPSKGHNHFLNNLHNSNRDIHRTWAHKGEYEQIWNYRYCASVLMYLKLWMSAVQHSPDSSQRRFVGTLRKHIVIIFALNNRNLIIAIGEELNRIAKIVKNQESGCYDPNSLADMIFPAGGELNITAHIPCHLRTQ